MRRVTEKRNDYERTSNMARFLAESRILPNPWIQSLLASLDTSDPVQIYNRFSETLLHLGYKITDRAMINFVIQKITTDNVSGNTISLISRDINMLYGLITKIAGSKNFSDSKIHCNTNGYYIVTIKHNSWNFPLEIAIQFVEHKYKGFIKPFIYYNKKDNKIIYPFDCKKLFKGVLSLNNEGCGFEKLSYILQILQKNPELKLKDSSEGLIVCNVPNVVIEEKLNRLRWEKTAFPSDIIHIILGYFDTNHGCINHPQLVVQTLLIHTEIYDPLDKTQKKEADFCVGCVLCTAQIYFMNHRGDSLQITMRPNMLELMRRLNIQSDL
jgi:hypothetical protein